MGTIDTNLEIIRTAVYGKDMRQAIHDAIAELNTKVVDIDTILRQDKTSDYIKYGFKGVHPEYTVAHYFETVTNESTMYGDDPYYLIPADGFDPSNDGLLVWRNGSELIYEYWYIFDSSSVEGQIKVRFSQPSYYQIGDHLQFTVYRKPPSVGSALPTYGTSAVYAPLASVASTIGSSIVDLTPNLIGTNDGRSDVRSSVNLGRLCTNVGGLAVVFVMHRAAVSIVGDNAQWNQYSVSHQTMYGSGDVSYSFHAATVFYRQLPANTPITISVSSGNESEMLFAAAVVYEGKSDISLISNDNALTCDPENYNLSKLYYNTSDEGEGFKTSTTSGGMDVWVLTTETVVYPWCDPLDTNYDPTDQSVPHPDSGVTDRVVSYGNTRIPIYVDEQNLTNNYMGFYLKTDKLVSQYQGDLYYTFVQYMHLVIT